MYLNKQNISGYKYHPKIIFYDSYHEATIDEFHPGKDPVLVGVQPVEGHLHIVPELPGTHLHAGEGWGWHPGHGYDEENEQEQEDDILTCYLHADGVSSSGQVVKGAGWPSLGDKMEFIAVAITG